MVAAYVSAVVSLIIIMRVLMVSYRDCLLVSGFLICRHSHNLMPSPSSCKVVDKSCHLLTFFFCKYL